MKSILRVLLLSATSLLLGKQAMTQTAPTPPMGWNSWDSYGLTINEDQMRANASVLKKRLQPFGWKYVVLDEGWYFTNPEARQKPKTLQYALDKFGRFLPAPDRFPSSAAALELQDGQSLIYSRSLGLASLGKWLHDRQMLFGIHIIRGIPKESVRLNFPIEGSDFRAAEAADQQETCSWDPTSFGVRDNAAGQAWYDSLLRQYADWGVDFLKVDCISDHPYRGSEIRQIHNAILKSGRTIVLSLSPGPTSLAHAEEVKSLSQMWRISNDVWDVWKSNRGFPESVVSQFPRLNEWSAFSAPGNWPDADMLPFGELRPKPDTGPGPRRSRLTMEEERTQLTLWSFARSPLILGANLTLLDDATTSLLTNADLIAVNQTATGTHQAEHEGAFVMWTAELPKGRRAFAFFNIGEEPLEVTRSLSTLGLRPNERLKNIWTGRTGIKGEGVQIVLAPHSTEAFLSDPR
jgi:hypothetical protein